MLDAPISHKGRPKYLPLEKESANISVFAMQKKNKYRWLVTSGLKTSDVF